MAEKLWYEKIDRNVDWGGDESTGNLPVAGSVVQDFIKSELNGKIGVIYNDEVTSKYLCFSNEDDKNEYLQDRSKEHLLLGSFVAPSSYKAKVKIDSHYNAILIGTKENYLTFNYEITNNDEIFIDNIRYEIKITKNGNSSILNGYGIYGKDVSINMDEFLSSEGTTEVSITIFGQTTGVVATTLVTYEVVNLLFESNYDVSTVYDTTEDEINPLAINYSIFGSSNLKYIEWYIDGEYLETDTIQGGTAEPVVDNKRISVVGMSHGVHNIQFRAYVIVNGEKFYTDTIYKEFIVVSDAAVADPMIAIEMTIPKEYGIANDPKLYGVVQYELYSINYGVYNPKNLEYIPVSIYLDDQLLSTVNAPNGKELTLGFTSNQSGSKSILFKAGDYVKELKSEVSKTSMDLQEITSNLALSLSASGRTNQDANKDEWSYGNYTTEFSGFNWSSTSGWNDNRLFISEGMSITTNIKPLLNTSYGKTIEIEFETTNVTNDDAVVCDLRDNNGFGLVISASKATMVVGFGEKESVSTNYMANENVRIGFVLDALNKLAIIYVNGIMSGAVSMTSNISIDKYLKFEGSSDAGIKLKQIRIYDTQMSSEQILNNYILYRDNISEIKALYAENDIMDGGVISPEKVSNFIPVILLTGEKIFELETKKDTDEEIRIDVEYINKKDPEHQFKFYGGCCRIQGTSSAGYVRKNWRIYSKRKEKFVADVYDWQGNLMTDSKRRIAFKDGAVPVNCWTLKADFAESSGTHNTGVATLWNEVMYNSIKSGEANDGYICRTNAQIAAIKNNYEYDCRTTVDGFPIVVFARRNENESYTFMGRYNFNNDKSTENVFGFCDIPGFDDEYIPGHEDELIPEGEFNSGAPYMYKNKMQCWEIRDSEDKYALFKTIEGWDDVQKDENGNDRIDDDKVPIKNWATGFEARYPDDANEADTSDLKNFIKWLVDCDKEKFANEKKDHLDIWKIAAYYVYLYRFGAVDQVAKNAMLTSEDGHHWYFINYDNDTILGLDNSGVLAYPPTINRDTKSGATYAYAGRESRLWNLLEDDTEFMTYYVPEVDNALYNGGLTYDNALRYFNINQCDKWSETIYNEDANYKYIQPYTSGRVNELAKMHGNRKSHRTWWLAKRFQLMDAKFNNLNSTSKYIHLKLEGSDFAEFTIKSSDPMYFSSVINKSPWYTGVFLDSGESRTIRIDRPFNQGSPIYVYSPLYIEELDLSSISEYLYLLEFGTLIDPVTSARMKRLVIGGKKTAKQMQALSGLNVLTNLEYLDLTGVDYPNIDISNLLLLKTLILTDSTINTLTLPDGCAIEDLRISDSLKSMNLTNLSNLSISNIHGFGSHHVSSITIKNSPMITDNFGYYYNWMLDAQPGDILNLEGIVWKDVDPMSLVEFKRLKQIGATLLLKGRIEISSPTLDQVQELQDIFGDDCFTNNSELWISAPDSVFIQGPKEIRSDTPANYSTVIFSKNPGTVEWSITSGSEYIVDIINNGDNTATVIPKESSTEDHNVTIKAVHTPANSDDSYVVPDSYDIVLKKINYANSGKIVGNATVQKDEVFTIDLGDDPYLGKFSTFWSISGDSVDNGSVSLSNNTGNSVEVKYLQQVIFDKCTINAHVLNNNGTSFDVTLIITITDETVLMTSTSNPKVLSICYANGLCDNKDVMYKSEARSCTDDQFGKIFNGTDIEYFNEFEYFTGLHTVSNSAFFACYNLKEIKIPANIQSIGTLAFGSTKIEKINIPTSVGSIAYNSFHETFNLKEFDVSTSNRKYKSIDGALVSSDNILIKFPSGKEVEEYTINGSIVGLGSESINNTKIKKLDLNNVETIYSNAIENNSYLEIINIGKRCNLTYITNNIANNNMLSCINVDEGNELLASHNGVLYSKDFSKLIKFPDNKSDFDILPVEIIGTYSFYACVKLTDVVIPDSVRLIENNSFYFSKITSLTFSESGSLERLGSYSVSHINSLRTVVLPASLKYIESNTFRGCPNVSSISFFGDAPTLTDVKELDGVRTITTAFGSIDSSTNWLMGNLAIDRIMYVKSDAIGYDHEDWQNSIIARNNYTLSQTL